MNQGDINLERIVNDAVHKATGQKNKDYTTLGNIIRESAKKLIFKKKPDFIYSKGKDKEYLTTLVRRHYDQINEFLVSEYYIKKIYKKDVKLKKNLNIVDVDLENDLTLENKTDFYDKSKRPKIFKRPKFESIEKNYLGTESNLFFEDREVIDIHIYCTTNSDIILNRNTYSIDSGNTFIKNDNLFLNELYEECFIWKLAFMTHPLEIKTFLNYQRKNFNDVEDVQDYINSLVRFYNSDYNGLFSKLILKEIKEWIKIEKKSIDKKERFKSEEKSMEIKEPTIIEEMSPFDQIHQTYPKVPKTLTNAQKALLFVFTFYYRNNIEIPKKEKLAEIFMILQGKNYSKKDNIFIKIFGRNNYYGKNEHLKTIDISKVVEYLEWSNNNDLIPFFNNFVKDYFS